MEWLIQILNSVQYGLLLFLVASGLTLIFGIMGVINLAHGSFYMIGAYLAFSLTQWTGSLWTALPLGIVLAAVLGLVLEWLFIARLYRRNHLHQVLLTFGLILVFEELRSILVGDDVHSVVIPAILDGSLPPRALRLVRDWAQLHPDERAANWQLAQALEPLVAIEPPA